MENRNMFSPPMVGYAFVQPQFVECDRQYSPEMGLAAGTMFPELNKPFGVYGMEGM